MGYKFPCQYCLSSFDCTKINLQLIANKPLISGIISLEMVKKSSSHKPKEASQIKGYTKLKLIFKTSKPWSCASRVCKFEYTVSCYLVHTRWISKWQDSKREWLTSNHEIFLTKFPNICIMFPVINFYIISV